MRPARGRLRAAPGASQPTLAPASTVAPARPPRLALTRPRRGAQGMYLLLVTNKQSNILEDLDTLRLLAKVVPEYCGVRARPALQRAACRGGQAAKAAAARGACGARRISPRLRGATARALTYLAVASRGRLRW